VLTTPFACDYAEQTSTSRALAHAVCGVQSVSGRLPSGRSPVSHRLHNEGPTMLVLGVILLILGFLLTVPILWTLGVILIIVGAVLWLAEGAGASWGRRWY
jgi:hypothetical protein